MGSLSKLKVTDYAGATIRAALDRVGLPPESVDEVLMGNVCSAGLGQAPARQATIKAGLPKSTPATTVNKVCASGMKTITFGAQSVSLGQNNVVVCGGFESMSNVPHYVMVSA